MWQKVPSSILAAAALGAVLGIIITPSPARAESATKPTPATQPDSKPAAKPSSPPAAKPASTSKEKPGSAPATPQAAPAPAKPSSVKKPETGDYDLTAAQKQRLPKYLPNAFAKLSSREPFHVVVLGDEIIGMSAPGDDKGNMLKAWPVRFLDELCSQFLYTGGVRLIRPTPGKPAKASTRQGPEITVRSLPRDGGLMTNAMQALTTYGFETVPDLVIVSFGLNDAASSQDMVSYAKALQEVIETVRSKGSEIILVGPTLTASEPARTSLGGTRAFSGMMRDAAEASNVLFADSGDLASLVKLDATTVEPANLLDQTLKQYRRFFTAATTDAFTHPQAELHRIVGRATFDLLLNGTKASPWKLLRGAATFDGPEHFTVTGEIENTSKESITLSLVALDTRRWTTKDTLPKIELKHGAKQPFKLTYQRNNEPADARMAPFASHEPFLRLPLLINGGDVTRLDEVHADIRPIAVLWKMDTMFNQEGSFTLENVVVNHSGAALKAVEWNADWDGQKKSGKLDLLAGGTGELVLKFDLPKVSARQAMPLVLNVTANGVAMRWERFIECLPNLGLKQDVPLQPLGDTKGKVHMRADADTSALFLTFDLDGVDLENSPTKTALNLQLNLDARSYGKRLTFGATEPITILLGAADGLGSTGKIAPWAFGTGYGMTYDAAFVHAQLSSGRNGARRVVVTLPRTYLYLHEWALGNGNSQLGINTRLQFWRNPREGLPKGGFPTDAMYSLTNNRKLDSDAEGLTVLELTDKPTDRWSVVIW